MTNTTEWERDVEHFASNIVYQLGDLLYETLPPDVAHDHFVDARQATNDRAIDFAVKIINKALLKQKSELVDSFSREIEGMRKSLTNRTVPLHGPEHEMEIARTNWTVGFNEALARVLQVLKERV